jgi:myosin heavy chain 6/7
LEAALEAATRGKSEFDKNSKRLLEQIHEAQQQTEEEQRLRNEIREQYSSLERRLAAALSEIEELKTALEHAERNRKLAESERLEANDRANELGIQISSLQAAKRKLESDIHVMHSDLEEASNEVRAADDRAKKALADSARVFDEVRQEQEHAQGLEKARKHLESQIKDLQTRLDEAESNSLKGGKKVLSRLEQRIRELEAELSSEQRRHAETQKSIFKTERRMKELSLQAEEDKKAHDKLADVVEKLQAKIKTYKRQVEEVEEIAAVNLTKYKMVQHELEEAEERAEQAEQAVLKMRAKNRSSTVAPGGSSSGLTVSVGRTTRKVVVSSEEI